jgi:hypothetical protein
LIDCCLSSSNSSFMTCNRIVMVSALGSSG